MRLPRGAERAWAGWAAACLAFAASVSAVGVDARPARGAAEEARASAAAEERRLAAARVEAAGKLRATEDALAGRAAETAALAAARDATASALAARAAALAPLLPVMERLALFPVETLLAAPGPPEEALRGLGIMRGIAAGLEREAAALRRDQVSLLAQERAVEASLPALEAARAALAEQGRQLEQQLAQAALATRTAARSDEAMRAGEAEAARAETLRAALAALEAARARGEAQARGDEARAERRRQEEAAAEARRRQAVLAPAPGPGLEPRGALTTPVAGVVTRGWGAATEAGRASGISFRPAPQARVVAPCGGRVRFAGPFRSYGTLVILDCGGGYAFVLAGLARLDVSAGAAVLAGEPVGGMPDWNPAERGPHPALYVELRRDGEPVDPAPFLRGPFPRSPG